LAADDGTPLAAATARFLFVAENRNLVQRHQIRGGSFRILQSAFGQFRSEFEHTHEMLTEIFAGQGARIIPMKDADHFRHYKTFLNRRWPNGSTTTRLTV